MNHRRRTPTDLQSVPFGHSGTSPHGAGDGTRTRNLLITNQLLCQVELRQQQEMAYSHSALKMQAKKELNGKKIFVGKKIFRPCFEQPFRARYFLLKKVRGRMRRVQE